MLSQDIEGITGQELLEALAADIRSVDSPDGSSDPIEYLSTYWPGAAEFAVKAALLLSTELDEDSYRVASAVALATLHRAVQAQEFQAKG